MSKLTRQVWAEVSLENIAYNVQQFRELIGPGCELMAVVKANGYGHGALETAYTMIAHGTNWLATALPEEVVRLRRGGITAPILVLGAVGADELDVCVAYDLAVTVFEPPYCPPAFQGGGGSREDCQGAHQSGYGHGQAGPSALRLCPVGGARTEPAGAGDPGGVYPLRPG